MADRDRDRSRDDELELIRQRLESLPQELLSALGERPASPEWPEVRQASASTLPDVGGPSASMFEPVVGRLEGVARLLEERLADQAGVSGATPKIYESQSLGGLIQQFPVPQAIGFADQAWGLPPGGWPQPHIPSGNQDWLAETLRRKKDDGDGPTPSPRWPEPPTPAAPPGNRFLGVVSPAGPSGVVMSSRDLSDVPGASNGPAPPGPPPAAAVLNGGTGSGDASGSLTSAVEQLRQEIAELRGALTDKSGAAADPSAGKAVAAVPTARQSSLQQPGGDLPGLPPHAVPSWKDAHQGGAGRPWAGGSAT